MAMPKKKRRHGRRSSSPSLSPQESQQPLRRTACAAGERTDSSRKRRKQDRQTTVAGGESEASSSAASIARHRRSPPTRVGGLSAASPSRAPSDSRIASALREALQTLRPDQMHRDSYLQIICDVWPTEPWDVCEASEDKDSLDDPKGHAWAECKACWRNSEVQGRVHEVPAQGRVQAPTPHLRRARAGSH